MKLIDLIEKLRSYPADSTVGIVDADTKWYGPIIHFDFDESAKQLSLYIKYREMEGPPGW